MLCLIAAVGFGVLYLLQPWWASQRLGKFDPQLSLIPVSLSSETEAPLSNSSIEQFGFEFRLPNKGLQNGKLCDQPTPTEHATT